MSLLTHLILSRRFRNLEGNQQRQPTLHHGLFAIMMMGLFLFIPHHKYDHDFHPWALIFVYIPLAIWFLSWVYLRAIQNGFSIVERRVEPVCYENDRVRVELTLLYRAPLPFSIALAQDSFPATDILTSPEILINSRLIDSHGRLVVAYETQANRGYGDFQIGPLRLRVSDPLGLFWHETELSGTAPLKVLLRQTAPEGLDLSKENALTPLGDSRSTRTGPSLEFFGTKEYQVGDDVRSICWSKTAQLGKIILKTFELDTRPDVLLVINTEAAKVKGLGFGSNLKHILRIGAGVLGACFETGLKANLLIPINESVEIITFPPTFSQHLFITDFLSKIEGSKSIDLPALLAAAAAKASPSTILIVLSHTLDIDLDPVLEWLFAMKARQIKVSLWSLDDTKMLRFADKRSNERIDKELFISRMEEFGIPVRLIPVKRPPPSEVSRSIEAD